MPVPQVQIQELADKIRAKRGDRTLRTVAKEIHVSFSTLNRVEQGRVPDLDTFAKLCQWLHVPPSTFMPVGVEPETAGNPKERIFAHLRADRTLDTKTAESLIAMIRHVYDTMGDTTSGKLARKTVARVH